jgi:hypothetical protein
MGASREEVERAFREGLKQLKCVGCGEAITNAAIDWGYTQPSEYARDGPFKLKCERCGKIQSYDVFRRKLTAAE